MVRFFRFAALLIISFAVITVILRALAAIDSPPIRGLFTNPDGTQCQMPCLFGIRTGETTFNDAIRLLKAHPLTRDLPSQYVQAGAFVGMRYVGNDVEIRLWPDDTGSNDYSRFVTSIDLIATNATGGALSLGDVIASLGEPERTGFFWSFDSSHLFFVSFYFDQYLRISHESTVNGDQAYIYASSRFVNLNISNTNAGVGHQSWRGFTSLERYTAAER
jgi:hypothetical protein